MNPLHTQQYKTYKCKSGQWPLKCQRIMLSRMHAWKGGGYLWV